MRLAIAGLILLMAPVAQAAPPGTIAAAAAEASKAAPSKPAPVLVAMNSDGGSGFSTATLGDVAAEPTLASLDAQSLSTIRVPETLPEKPARVLSIEGMPSRRNWIILSVVQHSAAAFDAYSTRRAVSSGAVEWDPLMRPFANSAGMYAAIQVGPLVLDYLARKMQRSPNRVLSRTWWLPQVVSTGMYMVSGLHNLTIANP